MEEFKNISVIPGPIVRIKNPTCLKLIGKGSQGAVFRLTDKTCVKIFCKRKSAEKEAEAYEIAGESKVSPKMLEAGANYIILEYIKGIYLDDYLASGSTITEKLTLKIMNLLDELKRLGFPRLDPSLRHTILTKDGDLKIIDFVHLLKYNKRRPSDMFRELGKLNLLKEFAEHVQKLDPMIYREWKDAIDRNLSIAPYK